MKRRPGDQADAAVLRRRTAARLRARKQRLKSESDAPRLRHELEVHQVELETQNEGLRRVKEELETALERYTELYDFGPVSYFTVAGAGTIRQMNLEGAALLGMDRARLKNQRLAQFVVEEDRPAFASFLKQVLASPTSQSCEVTLRRTGLGPLFVRMKGVRSKDGQECRMAAVDITEHRAAQNALLASEQHYRAVVEDQTELISRCRPDGTFTFVSEAYCRFFGKTAGELVGSKWYPRALAEDLPVIEERLRLLSPANPLVVIENRVRSGAGEVRWMQFANRGFFDRAGRPVETQSVGRDITELKRVEEALRTSEERFRVALAAVPLVVFNQDRELRYSWIGNPALGVTADALIGRTDEEIFGAERAAPLIAIKRRVLATGRGERQEVYLEREGHAGWFDLMVEPLRDASGKVVGITCAALDITKRKKAESALRESEEHFATVFRASPLPIGINRLRDGVFLDVNNAFLRLHGYDREEVVGHASAELKLWHSANREAVYRELREQKRPQVVEMQGRHKSGEVRDLIASIELIEVAGEPCVLGVLTDITERKRAATELEASRTALRALAARVEAVREEERRKLARDIHDTFGHALTDWKFDLSWLGRRLEEAGIGGRTAIRRRVAAMSKRAEAEMETARRIAGALRPALLDSVGLAPAIEWLARDFQTRTGLRCRVAVPAGPLTFSAPLATAIFRMAQELLTNVARHAKASAAELRLVVADGRVELHVRDNGCGISDRTARNPTSLGLVGLRERAVALGGEFEIKGSSRHGTTATVRLPLAQESQPG